MGEVLSLKGGVGQSKNTTLFRCFFASSLGLKLRKNNQKQIPKKQNGKAKMKEKTRDKKATKRKKKKKENQTKNKQERKKVQEGKKKFRFVVFPTPFRVGKRLFELFCFVFTTCFHVNAG